jgi:acetylornithine deacetylase
MNDTETRVLDALDREAMLTLAGDLIRIPSFPPDETPVAEYLEPYFRERRYEVEMQEVEPGRFQTVARLRGSGGGRTLLFDGHTDINSLTRGGTRDPWTPAIEGDRLYGHGVQNMKGGVASMIAAAEAIRTSGAELRGDLVVACVVGETRGGEGTHHLVESGFRADAAVLPEPMGTENLLTVHGGIIHLAIHTFGVTGHLSQMERTVNAVEKMTKVIGALKDVKFTYRPYPALPALPIMNVGSVIGGRGEGYVLVEPPYIPDLCTIIVDVHFVPGMTRDSMVADLRRAIDPMAAADPQLKYEIEVPPPEFFRGRRKLVMNPVDVPTDAEIVRLVARKHEQVAGGAPRTIGALLPLSYSAGDACWLWGAGIPSLYYGGKTGFGEPGADASYALIGEMETCAKTLALSALEFCA